MITGSSATGSRQGGCDWLTCEGVSLAMTALSTVLVSDMSPGCTPTRAMTLACRMGGEGPSDGATHTNHQIGH